VFIEANAQERTQRAQEAEYDLRSRAESGDDDAFGTRTEGVAKDQLAWVTHEDCEHFSRDFGALLDVEDLVPGSEYTLEVSSPGLDRKLSKAADYERFRGSLVEVQTWAPIAGNRHWQGRLTQVKAGSVELDLKGAKQSRKKKAAATVETVEIDFANIEKANLIPEF
jgi:ribosome maturation factor RimP